MKHVEKVCGNCANHKRTSKYGCYGGKVKACRPEHQEWQEKVQGARYFTRDYKGYGPRHHCHRQNDFRAKVVEQ